MVRQAAPGGGFIRAVRVEVPPGTEGVWPFSIPAISGWGRRTFDPGVTFLVGENGSGKSTLIEALAVAMGLNAEGGSRNMSFSTTQAPTPLADHIVVEKSGRPRTDYFLRAESFYNVASHIDALDLEPGLGAAIKTSYGGKSLHTRSHGESFIATMTHRFGAGGLYLLDEPESALSFRGCLALLRVMNDLVRDGSQFVVATHSPLILAMPQALIYGLDDAGVQAVDYDDAEPVVRHREFLAAPDRFLRHLFADDV